MVDQMGECSFPASDPPSVWTWEVRGEDEAMNSGPHPDSHARDLLNAARAFQTATGKSESARVVPAALGSLEKAVQALSASWYQLAANAPLAGEQMIYLIALHDVAAAFDRCAQACRDARSTVAPLIARTTTAQAGQNGRPPRFERRQRPTGRAA
jgi:hypothetical protein